MLAIFFKSICGTWSDVEDVVNWYVYACCLLHSSRLWEVACCWREPKLDRCSCDRHRQKKKQKSYDIVFIILFYPYYFFDLFSGQVFLAMRSLFRETSASRHVKLRCVRDAGTACHFSCNLGLKCETALRIAECRVAWCETAKVRSPYRTPLMSLWILISVSFWNLHA